jgi:hypothetical protein
MRLTVRQAKFLKKLVTPRAESCYTACPQQSQNPARHVRRWNGKMEFGDLSEEKPEQG